MSLLCPLSSLVNTGQYIVISVGSVADDSHKPTDEVRPYERQTADNGNYT